MDSNLEKDDLVGIKLEDLASTASTNAHQPQNPAVAATARPGQFGLGDRAERLLSREGLQAAILLPHAAAKNDAKVGLLHGCFTILLPCWLFSVGHMTLFKLYFSDGCLRFRFVFHLSSAIDIVKPYIS